MNPHDDLKAMILGAGRGTRLGEIARSTPKVLVPVRGIAMLDRLLAWMARNGISDVALNTHHLASRVEEHTAGLSGRSGMARLQLFHESELLGTGGALLNIREFWGNSPLLLWNGDILADLDLNRLLAIQARSDGLATLLVQERKEAASLLIDRRGFLSGVDSPNRGGRRVVGGQITGLRPVAFNGISLLSPRLLQYIERVGSFDLIDALLDVVAQGRLISTCDAGTGFWGTTGSMAELSRLETGLRGNMALLDAFTPPAVPA